MNIGEELQNAHSTTENSKLVSSTNLMHFRLWFLIPVTEYFVELIKNINLFAFFKT